MRWGNWEFCGYVDNGYWNRYVFKDRVVYGENVSGVIPIKTEKVPPLKLQVCPWNDGICYWYLTDLNASREVAYGTKRGLFTVFRAKRAAVKAAKEWLKEESSNGPKQKDKG